MQEQSEIEFLDTFIDYDCIGGEDGCGPGPSRRPATGLPPLVPSTASASRKEKLKSRLRGLWGAGRGGGGRAKPGRGEWSGRT